MRTTLIALFSLITVFTVTAQDAPETIVTGDTVELRLTGHHGSIQWQESTDSSAWADMTGFTDSVAVFIATASPTNKKYYRAVVTDSLCPNASPVYSSVIRHNLVGTVAEVQIGDLFRGGVVFYTGGSGNGTIAPQQDQGTGIEWGCDGTSISGAASFTDGAANTAAICDSCATRPIAASVCQDLELNGYNDWFLPARDQLNEMYLQQTIVGGFSIAIYWSSTEDSENFSWAQNFYSGAQGGGNKYYTTYFLRCARSYDAAGQRDVSLTTIIDQPVNAGILTQPQEQNGCLGDSATFTITATGTEPFAYQWKKDGEIITGATGNTLSVGGLTPDDEALYSCELTNLCGTVASDNVQLNVIQLTASAGNDTQVCIGQGTTLSAAVTSNHPAESGSFSYWWSPASGLSAAYIFNPVASPASTTDYTVLATDQLGCTSTDVMNVFVQDAYQNEQICLVTVDTITGKNKVLWEKTIDVGTEYYLVYKETGVNSYSQIGNAVATQPGAFVDYSSQPEIHGDKYKITVLDTCGNESDLNNCYYHKTVNLTIAAYGTTMGLNWDDYIDESGSFVPFSYYIYRGTSSSDMVLYDSVSGSFNSYNDVNVTGVYYYMIGVKKDSGCDSVHMSYSNKKDNIGLVNILREDMQAGQVIITPNPMNAFAIMTIPGFNANTYGLLRITDLTGKTVKTVDISGRSGSNEQSGIMIRRDGLNPGVYLIEMKSDRVYRGKLVVE